MPPPSTSATSGRLDAMLTKQLAELLAICRRGEDERCEDLATGRVFAQTSQARDVPIELGVDPGCDREPHSDRLIRGKPPIRIDEHRRHEKRERGGFALAGILGFPVNRPRGRSSRAGPAVRIRYKSCEPSVRLG